MKSVRIIFVMVLSAIFVCCTTTSKNKEGDAPEKNNTSHASAKDMKDTPIDVRCFGMVGHVKEFTFKTAEILPDSLEFWEDAVAKMEFDKDGRILNDCFGNLYQYDDKGNFIKGVSELCNMLRDEKGRIVFYENKKDDDYNEKFTMKFGYDELDRMTKVEIINWESTIEQVFTFSDDNIYPDHEKWDIDHEGEIYTLEVTYTYKNFDSKGNWTERETHSVNKHITEDSPETEVNEYNTIEQREITYYP